MSDLSYLVAKQRQDKFDYYKIREELQTRRRIIGELEKIKAEINEEDIDCQYEDDYVYSGGLQKAIEIIDNRIAELKGE